MSLRATILQGLVGLALFAGVPAQAAYNVLWWDSTPDYGGQAPNAFRQAMSDYLTNNTAGTFNSTYVGSETPGTLATQLGANSYDVLIFDATSGSAKFNSADLSAVTSFYQTRSNVLLDGTLYIRNISYSAATAFPGPNSAFGSFTANEAYSLAIRGGGVMIGTDHNCCQTDANQILQAMIPGASFSGVTYPTTDGIFTGTELLNGLQSLAPADIFYNWSNVPTEAITPTGNFTDAFNNAVTLYSQVDVRDVYDASYNFLRQPYISTSFAPGGAVVVITDTDPPPTNNNVPEPASMALLGLGLAGLGIARRRRS